MSASLIDGYTGLLEDVHVVAVAQIFGFPITEQDAQIKFGHGMIGPSQRFNFQLVRDALFDQIKAFQSNAQVESRVLRLVSQWDSLPLADHVEETIEEDGKKKTIKWNVRRTRREIRQQLQQIYPIIVDDGNTHMIQGR